ncbi:hypothetical protein REC12_23795 [Desulfosporosinus sp. PR]|nr:hypothetical protein [Desulfosporosinus sp. PR]MDQ7096623.1 hypothetical protein [Desulfosporosinus sp. PR]
MLGIELNRKSELQLWRQSKLLIGYGHLEPDIINNVVALLSDIIKKLNN